jgi:hypothetical protein
MRNLGPLGAAPLAAVPSPCWEAAGGRAALLGMMLGRSHPQAERAPRNSSATTVSTAPMLQLCRLIELVVQAELPPETQACRVAHLAHAARAKFSGGGSNCNSARLKSITLLQSLLFGSAQLHVLPRSWLIFRGGCCGRRKRVLYL